MAKRKKVVPARYKKLWTIRARIEALFLDNLGIILTREDILRVAKDPKTGQEPENWHQRLSELRTDHGYTILSNRDGQGIRVGEYMMPNAKRRKVASKRIRINPAAWQKVLRRAGHACEWEDGGARCGLKQGDVDPVGGGRSSSRRTTRPPMRRSQIQTPTILVHGKRFVVATRL